MTDERKWVIFDIGETLIDETRYWKQWAVELGFPELTWFAILGGVIGRSDDHRKAFEIARPGFNLFDEVTKRGAGGDGYFEGNEAWFGRDDLYPDAIPCLQRVREAGFRVGIAGNQTAGMEARLQEMGITLDLAASSGRWKTYKPDPEFFTRLAEEAGSRAEDITYVGDYVTNDIIPSLNAGMRPVFIRRGPWGFLQQENCPEGVTIIDSLDQLPTALK